MAKKLRLIRMAGSVEVIPHLLSLRKVMDATHAAEKSSIFNRLSIEGAMERVSDIDQMIAPNRRQSCLRDERFSTVQSLNC